jgi:hypothetical protein
MGPNPWDGSCDVGKGLLISLGNNLNFRQQACA